MSFYRASGLEDVRKLTANTATAFAVGQLVKSDTTAGELVAATTNTAWLGVTRSSKSAAVAGTIDVDVIHPGDTIKGTPTTTLTSANNIKLGDISTVTTFTTTNTNGDFLIMYVGETDGAILYPRKLETGAN